MRAGLLWLFPALALGFSNSTEWIMLHYNECSAPDHKHFKGETLAYVTPWNSAGWGFAVKYARKLDYVVPVWHQVSVADDGLIEVKGDGNETWVQEVHKVNPNTKVVPRVILEKTSKKAYALLLDTDKDIDAFAKQLISFANDHKYPGLTMELWLPGSALLNNSKTGEEMALHIRFIERVAKAFKRAGVLLILPVPPARAYQYNDFDSGAFLRLSPFVHRFHVMTYDFSTSTAGPNSPLVWIESMIDFLFYKFDAEGMEEEEADAKYMEIVRKIMIGLPFYGYLYTPLPKAKSEKSRTHSSEPITGNDYLDMINDYKPTLEWQEKYHEHSFKLPRTSQEVYYPTQTMLALRLEAAARLSLGVGIWELGQGLDLFFDLL